MIRPLAWGSDAKRATNMDIAFCLPGSRSSLRYAAPSGLRATLLEHCCHAKRQLGGLSGQGPEGSAILLFPSICVM